MGGGGGGAGVGVTTTRLHSKKLSNYSSSGTSYVLENLNVQI